jgi:very-short-patch-repair endonuclease
VLAAGAGSFLGFYAGAELHGLLRRPARRIDILAPGPRVLPVHVHTYRRLHPLDVTERDGIPVTSVARTLVDLTELADVDELANLIHEAAFRGSFSALATRDAMARAHGRSNLHKLEAALAAHEHGSAGTKSGNERALKRLIREAGLPEPRSNVHVEGIEVDLFWPDRRLVVEVDGHGHGRKRTRREDRLKQRLLEAHGYAVVRVAEDEIGRPAVARLAEALAQ